MDPDPTQERPNVFDAFLSIKGGKPAPPAPNGVKPVHDPLELMDRVVELETKAAAIRRDDASTQVVLQQAAYLQGKAEQQKHEALEARHKAVKEPGRQAISLWERKLGLLERGVKLLLLVFVAIFIMAFLVVCLIISPWLFLPVGTSLGALAYLARGQIKGVVAPGEEEDDP